MIDVRFVIAHGLWILGTAVVLAAFSYHGWLARERQIPLRQVLRGAGGWRMSIVTGVLLVACGFLLMQGTHWWERGLWLLALAWVAFDLWRLRSTT